MYKKEELKELGNIYNVFTKLKKENEKFLRKINKDKKELQERNWKRIKGEFGCIK